MVRLMLQGWAGGFTLYVVNVVGQPSLHVSESALIYICAYMKYIVCLNFRKLSESITIQYHIEAITLTIPCRVPLFLLVWFILHHSKTQLEHLEANTTIVVRMHRLRSAVGNKEVIRLTCFNFKIKLTGQAFVAPYLHVCF